jgi:hypothetical protein
VPRTSPVSYRTLPNCQAATPGASDGRLKIAEHGDQLPWSMALSIMWHGHPRGLAAATVAGGRLPRWFATLVTIYFGFLAVFVPLREFPVWVKNAPRSAADVYLVIVATALILGCYRGWRLALRFDASGVTVRNYFRTYRIGWSDVNCFADGNAGLATSQGFAWTLSIVTRERRPVIASATARYHGARPETLTAVRHRAELHGIAADLAGVAKKVRPRRRNFAGDILVWLGITAALFYALSLLDAAGGCTTC